MPDPSRKRKPPRLEFPEAEGTTEHDRAEFEQALDNASDGNPDAAPLPSETRRTASPASLLRDLRRGSLRLREESSLSLRHLTQDEARLRLENFLRARRLRGDRFVRIIHGKGYRSAGGRPVLARRVPEWLDEWKPELVAAWGEARREDGGSGALYVVLA